MKQIKLIFVMALSCVLTLGIAGQQSTSATVPGNNQFLVTNMSGAKSGGIPTDMSGDGRYIVFSSWASDLVPNDTNNKEDVFVKDRVNNTFTRVSIATNGTQSDNKSWNAKISYDGRYVVFQSLSTTFGVSQTFGDLNGHIFRYDRQTSILEHVNQINGGYNTNDPDNDSPDISADGRFITYSTDDKNLAGFSSMSFSQFGTQIVVKDMVLNTVKLISHDTSGNPVSPGADSASISCDGGIVAFVSSSSAYSSNGKSNLIVNTRAGGDYITVANPTNSNWGIGGKVQVSCDGNHVAFESSATNLVDPNSTVQPSGQRIYSYSHVDKKIRYVSVTPSGQPMISGDDGQGRRPISISENGRYVVYISNSHLGNTKPQVYITDMVAGTSQILSINSSGDPGDWNSYNPVVSGDGKFVAFDTSANNLITGGSAGSAILSETGY